MTNIEKIRMDELQSILRNAADAYYNEKEEVMSNKEYDDLYDELVALETKTGVIYKDSITQITGAEVVDSLKKVTHEYPALSLAKTKDPLELVSKMNKNPLCIDSVMMWKMDGSTVIATYDNGKLTQLATRGNGAIGSDITHNAPYIKGLPQTIDFKGHMVVRGEAVMTYTEFNRINEALPEGEEKYKNPRNLANATISLLDSKEMREREIKFFAFNNVAMIDTDGGLDIRFDSFSQRLDELERLGFQTVEHSRIRNTDIENCVRYFTDKVNEIDFPVDGLVIASDDAVYAEKQPGTGHNPNTLSGFAFKWEDELVKTTLRDIEWSVGRTGAITPVAIFDPVEICGTSVSRASMHNLSEMDRLLGTAYIGQEIDVFKANMIIPQIYSGVKLQAENKVNISIISHPTNCPCCKAETKVKVGNNGVKTLNCVNGSCPAREIGKFSHFVSRDCMNIIGFSDESLEKFINRGYIKNFVDIYNFTYDYGNEIINMEGFGKKSLENLDNAIEKSRHTTFVPFIHALGIPNIGKGQAKLLLPEVQKFIKANPPINPSYYGEDLINGLLQMVYEGYDFTKIDGFGTVLDKSLKDYFMPIINDEMAYADTSFADLVTNMIFEDKEPIEKSLDTLTLSGLNFVVTGDVHIYKNRNELTKVIEELGGKVSSSVSKNTNYLINNDYNSTSSKNKKAKELDISIITEEEFEEIKLGVDKDEEIDR